LDDRLAFDAASRPRLKEEDSIDNVFLGDIVSTWTFLNVFGESLQLDTFTLDDYIDALRYQEVDFPCELTVEIHCALLKALVSEDEPECLVTLPTHRQSTKPAKNGSIAIDLVKIEDECTSDPGTISSQSTDTPFLYSSLLELRATATKPGSQSWTDWRTKIQLRDFTAGGWEYALIGILDELGNSYRLTTVVVDILEQLLPDGEKHTRKLAKENYARMDAKLKVKAIQLLVQLVCQTPTVREFIEDSMSHMTELRKEKVEVQRERKLKLEELAVLESELHPYTTPEESTNGHESDTTELDAPTQKRSFKASLKRKREEAEEAAAAIKRNKEYAKRLKVVDQKRQEIKACEEKVTNYDHYLREKDCQRLRLLGKDRFFNRYWILEGNGLPNDEIRGDATYASGRLWVQGPSVEDAMYFLGGAGVDLEEIPYGRVSAVDTTSSVNEDLRERILLRKEREEGQTVLYDECQWGYYGDSEAVEGLIAWLNPKGVREAKLRLAILARKDELYKLMEAREKVWSPLIGYGR
jgi:DDT domain/Williams-Beuren syndrome DDT (WSD), D-TOX E motif